MTDRTIIHKKSRRKPKSRPPRNHWRSLTDHQLEYWVYVYTQAQQHDGLYSENGKDAGALFRQSQPTMSRWSDRLVQVGAARWERKKERSPEDGSYLPNILRPSAPPYAVRGIVQENVLRQNASICNMNMDKPVENKATSLIHIQDTAPKVESDPSICNLHDHTAHISSTYNEPVYNVECAVGICKVNMDSASQAYCVPSLYTRAECTRDRAQIEQELKEAYKELGKSCSEEDSDKWSNEITRLQKELADMRGAK